VLAPERAGRLGERLGRAPLAQPLADGQSCLPARACLRWLAFALVQQPSDGARCGFGMRIEHAARQPERFLQRGNRFLPSSA